MATINDYLTGSANPEGLNETFKARITQMVSSLPPALQGQVLVFSAYRSPEHQARLYADAIKKYGSEAAARRWVAPPGKSNHNHGAAIDLRFSTDAARRWMHENAARFGLEFPMAHEPWHIEPAGLRGGQFAEHSADAEAYTDGLGLTPVDNHSHETQLLRLVDTINQARTPGVGERTLRTGAEADVQAAADRNTAGIMNEVK